MKRLLNKISGSALFIILGIFSLNLYAATAQLTPVGKWKTIDDVTGKPHSIIEISKVNDSLEGTITQIFWQKGDTKNCIKCTGEFYNKPVEGLKILWGFHYDGNKWVGGKILDPSNGKIYHATLQLNNNGEVLNVRGYIGIPLFGRTENWLRMS